MSLLVTATLAVALGFVSSAGAAPKQARAKARVHTVTIDGTAFVPATLDVGAGDTVVWVNKDLVPHTATGGGFDSGAIASGKSWTHVLRTQGDIAYTCTFHPTMKATVRVK